MIRLPPSRILPGTADIHEQITRLFRRATTRYLEFLHQSEEDIVNNFEDDYGDDLPSINDEDISPPLSICTVDDNGSLASGLLDYASECLTDEIYNGNWNGNVSCMGDLRDFDMSRSSSGVSNEYQDSSRRWDRNWDRDSHRTNGTYETALESVRGLADDGPSSMGDRESTRANRHSLQSRLSLGGRVVGAQHPWRGHSLIPVRRFNNHNPRVMLALTEDLGHRRLWLANQHAGLSSLGSLLENLSLDTFPENTDLQTPKLPENQRLCPQTKEKNLRFGTDFDDLIRLNRHKSRPSQLNCSPDHAISAQNNRMPATLQDDGKADIPMRDTLPSRVTEPNTTESEEEARFKKPRKHSSASNLGASTSGKRNIRNTQTPSESVQGKESTRETRASTSQMAGRGASRTLASGASYTSGRRQSSGSPINAPQPQPQNEAQSRRVSNEQGTTENATQNHPASRRASDGQAPSSTNPTAPAMAPPSSRTTPSVQPQVQTRGQAQPQSQPRLEFDNPLLANISPEKAQHLMEVARSFQTHVNEMLSDVDDEGDNADEFGLGDICRRSLGGMMD